jgi:GH24 family phage-related lysozyme (muramidase)
MMRLSQRGVNLIKSFEGFSAVAYKPVKAEKFWTIGYGDYGPHVHQGQRITRAEAEKRLRRRLKEFEAGVDRLVTTHINQNRFDALVSLAYNIGLGAFANSTVLRMVNQRKFKRAAAAFHLFVFGATGKLLGLVRRRNAEARLFVRPLRRPR